MVKLRIEIMYKAAEYAEMLILYGECGRNAREDAREYAIRFPRRLPRISTVGGSCSRHWVLGAYLTRNLWSPARS
jgi:hypothetical protein